METMLPVIYCFSDSFSHCSEMEESCLYGCLSLFSGFLLSVGQQEALVGNESEGGESS